MTTALTGLRARLVALAVATLAVFAVASPGTAHAYANGCTQLGSWTTNAVCITVDGSGKYVSTANSRVSLAIGVVCNTRLYITFYDVYGNKYDQRVSSIQYGCTNYRKFTQTYNKYMKAGRACGAVSENGVMRPGACVSIY